MDKDLPIFEVLDQLHQTLLDNSTALLYAPPGAGKSTIVPLVLLKSPWLQEKKIILLEPRKIAARAVAQRMSNLLGEEIGETVGYRIRFDHRTSAKTKIEVVTEGILTRMLQKDNALEGIGLVIFDEFHERSIHADLSLALCKDVQQLLRDDLRILIMSATLDISGLGSKLKDAPLISCSGRQHPIKILYLDDAPELKIYERMGKAIAKALKEQEGDILAFLPGAFEIAKTKELLSYLEAEVNILPLYGELSIQEQQKAIQISKDGKRKVVLSTSLAETSLTIEGIKTVVDSGLVRVPKFDPKTGLNRLVTLPCSQDVATQRAGRAGRLSSGVCYRLWSEITQRQLNPHRSPEILEADLTSTMLELYEWGTKNFQEMMWLDAPPKPAVEQAKLLLTQLAAISNEKITNQGKKLLLFPTHPRIAHLLMEGKNIGQSELVADVAAILEEKDPLSKNEGADIAIRIEVLRKWRQKNHINADQATLSRIEKLSAHWRKLLGCVEDNTLNFHNQLGKLIFAAYPERIARKQEKSENRYKLGNGRVLKLEPQDPLGTENFLAIAHLDSGMGEGKIFLAAAISKEDLEEHFTIKSILNWDYQKGILVSAKAYFVGDLMISSKPNDFINEEERVKLLKEVIQKEGISLFELSPEFEEWRNRVHTLQHWYPHQEWPRIKNEELILYADKWFQEHLVGIRKKEDFKKINLLEIVQSSLSWEQLAEINKLAPEKIKVPSGFEVKITYDYYGGNPSLAVRLQEMFGLAETPRINNGKTALTIHLLSPGYKPVQVTQDLKSFWLNAYPEVRKQLKIRYPKHAWPEDPWTAEPIRGVKKKVL